MLLGSLRARLTISFALVVALAVFLAGFGALFLLRDQQQATLRERYGRFAEPLNLSFNGMLGTGSSLDEAEAQIDESGRNFGVRVIIINQDLKVVHDSEGKLVDKPDGTYILSFENPSVRVIQTSGARYKAASYGPGNLELFAQSDISEAQRPYNVLVGVPAGELSAAWLDLAPRLAIACAIALVASFVVAFFISRSISGPLRRITEASREMAQGHYDVHIPIRGEDEVGRLADAFNGMAKEVSRSQQMMKDLLANVSHELKTPLTSIQGFSQAMIDGAVTTDEDFKESGRIINEEANRMRALVEDLLLLSRMEMGQVPLEHKHVELVPMLEQTLERFQWAIRDAGIQSGTHIEYIPPVHGDARRLEQVFSNLIENAVRHTPQGGVITVSAMTLRNGDISIGVHNTGSVIPPEDLPRVFERFFQVDRARARKGGSSGLGLSIVAEIIEAHGGSVRVVSDVDRGTEFIVTLPSATPQPQTRRSRAKPAAPRKRDPKHREAPAG